MQKRYIKDKKRYKKDTKDIHKKIYNFHLISFGKMGDKMRGWNGTESAWSTMLIKKRIFLKYF
jgi:hypothetical protein